MRILPILTILLVWTSPVFSQVDIELFVEQEQFLRDEPVPVKVRITNRSGQTLRLGEGNNWITFGVDVLSRTPVERIGQPPVAGPFDLESAHTATREVDLQPWFDLTQPGRYSVSATVHIKQWDKDLSARPKSIEIVRGAKLWEQEVGVPSPSGAPEVRRFILQQANYRKQPKLYARLANQSDTFAIRVLPLGSLVSFGRPEAQVDEDSSLHVLFQTGARSFQYSVMNASGALTARQTYDYGASRPTLKLNEFGKIHVAGGIRRFNAGDLPPVKEEVPKAKDVELPRK